MWTYGFRLRFRTPAGRIIGNADPELPFALEGVNGTLVLNKLAHKQNHTPGTPETFLVIGSGFHSEEEARTVGRRLKTALAVYGATIRMGVDTGRDRVTSGTSTAVKENIRAQFSVQLRDVVHGLDVYSEELPVTHLEISATGTAHFVAENFVEKVAHEFKSLSELPPKLSLALELYNLTHFEPATKTRFLTLVTVVEVLSTRARRPKHIRDQLDACMDLVRGSDLSVADQHALISGLGNLKRESIGSACSMLVANHISQDAADFFSECYSARSELLHDGETNRSTTESLIQLDEVVQITLLACIHERSARPVA